MENGCTMHLGVREGDVAARVLSVGDVGRGWGLPLRGWLLVTCAWAAAHAHES
jgi:hypothetical protein